MVALLYTLFGLLRDQRTRLKDVDAARIQKRIWTGLEIECIRPFCHPPLQYDQSQPTMSHAG